MAWMISKIMKNCVPDLATQGLRTFLANRFKFFSPSDKNAAIFPVSNLLSTSRASSRWTRTLTAATPARGSPRPSASSTRVRPTARSPSWPTTASSPGAATSRRAGRAQDARPDTWALRQGARGRVAGWRPGAAIGAGRQAVVLRPTDGGDCLKRRLHPRMPSSYPL